MLRRVRTTRRLVGVLLVGVLSLALLATGALRQAHASGPEPLLPNLVADPPDNMTLVSSSIEGKTRLLLRFNGYVHNAGPGALDIRASREAPTVKNKTAKELYEEVLLYKYKEESLPQGLEEELVMPKMKVSQRLYTTNLGNPAESERYLERPHVEEASGGEMLYVNADGHHHWHLQHVAKYSLWNAGKTAEVAPAQKVGFCLDDSQHVEPNVGPATPVYADDVAPYRRFCRRFEPNATSVYEGISPGWRDVYGSELAFQWVDASDVLPGEYWLREDVDPTGVIKQTGGGAKSEYAKTPTIIPGFDAEAQTVNLNEGEGTTVSLLARSYEDHATPQYTVVSQPQHGVLGEVKGSQVTYTPGAGYSGTDSFTFSARDPTSQFPEHPAVATVSIAVKSMQPTISISGTQAEMTAGTSVELSATVANDTGGVEWQASAGTLTPGGPGEEESLYKAPPEPPEGGKVTVTARLKDDPAVSDTQTIAIKPVPPPEPTPELPPTSNEGPVSTSGSSQSQTTTTGTSSAGGSGAVQEFKAEAVAASVSRPREMLVGRTLVMTTVPSAAGRIRLAAYLGRRELGTCVTQTPAGRTFTCRLRLGRGISLRARISVRASLRVGDVLVATVLPAQRIPEMKMRPVGASAHTASGQGIFWCSPSTLTGVLVGN